MEEFYPKNMMMGPLNPNEVLDDKIKKSLPPLPLPPMPKFRKKTAQEKRNRMSGKNTHKPYISSSLGDMARHMIRMACTDNTLGYTEPPPADFYDFWQKFSVSSQQKLPTDYVDLRKVSVARLKMKTSSFDFFGNVTPKNSQEQFKAAEEAKPGDEEHNLAPALSDLWKNVRISMSTESFISSSTKVSEPHDNVPLGGGWSDEEDEELSESDNEYAASETSVLKGAEALYTSSQAGGTGHDGSNSKMGGGRGAHANSSATSVMSYQSKNTKQNKEIGALAASILQMELEEQRIAMDLALKEKPKNSSDIVDYFMDDLDDSFLKDVISYGLLPDSAFIPDFDYFNEDPIFKERERKREQEEADALALLQPKGKDKKDGEKPKRKTPTTLEVELSEMTLSSSESDGDADAEEEAGEQGLGGDEALKKDKAPVAEEKVMLQKLPYKTCLEVQKKQIEDNLRAAVRCRSAMGSFKVPRGGQPLARTFAFKTPGPAKYNPKVNCVKPKPPGVFFAKRWQKSIYETPGPGPAAYLPSCKCTSEYLNLHEAPRFTDSESVGPGPATVNLSKYLGTAKGKPHAIITSRRPQKKIECGGSKFLNCYGLSRVGPRNPPKALIISRHVPKEKIELGPGAYDPYAAEDTRIGIELKSRWPENDWEETPGYVNLPDLIGKGPGISFGLRRFEIQHADSPGPIYMVPPPAKKPLTMTFRPFPMPGREADPSPIEYGTKPGDMAMKMTFPAAPRPVMIGSHDLSYGIGKSPGPAKYKIKKCNCKEGIVLKGRHETKQDILPGPTDYKVGVNHLPIPPRAVFQHRPSDKPPKQRSPGFVYDPKNPNHVVKGGLMAPRWRSKASSGEGSRLFNLFGFTSRGKYSKIPITLKSRHSPFVYAHLSDNPEIPKQQTCGVEFLKYQQKPASPKQC